MRLSVPVTYVKSRLFRNCFRCRNNVYICIEETRLDIHISLALKPSVCEGGKLNMVMIVYDDEKNY